MINVVTITLVVGASDITTNVCGDKQNTLAPQADCYADLMNWITGFNKSLFDISTVSVYPTTVWLGAALQ